MAAPVLTYEGCNFLRQRLILSTLSGKPVKIKKIRHKDDSPGLQEFEASLLRLLDKVTNGTVIEINETGTNLYYQPGLLVGDSVEHDCCTQRAIGYYLETLVCLAPFTKKPLKAVLRGVTNDKLDPSVDVIKLSIFPVLKKFLGIDEGFELKINRRGAAPDGGGEVLFKCPCRQKLRPVQFTDPGKIKRIRGVAWAARVSPAIANRIVDSTRSILNKCLPDIYIYTDHNKGSQSGKSPGFGLTLVAETTNGVFLAAELMSNPKGSEDGPTVPEELGKNTAVSLLGEIYRGGCVDSFSQSVACLLMTLGQKDVSKILTGPLSPYTVQFLRHMKDFFEVMFKIEPKQLSEDDDLNLGGQKLLLTCVGIGYQNLSKAMM